VNASKLDKEIWDEFSQDWDKTLLQSETLLATKSNSTIEKLNHVEVADLLKDGLEKERLVKTRVNQSIFRTVVLATYNSRCCITGVDNTELLIASHIVPWSKDDKNRLNPMNGLCLNTLHDRAFDSGLIAISPEDYSVILSPQLKKKKVVTPAIESNFIAYEHKQIILPDKFLPLSEFLDYHYQHIFKK